MVGPQQVNDTTLVGIGGGDAEHISENDVLSKRVSGRAPVDELELGYPTVRYKIVMASGAAPSDRDSTTSPRSRMYGRETRIPAACMSVLI